MFLDLLPKKLATDLTLPAPPKVQAPAPGLPNLGPSRGAQFAQKAMGGVKNLVKSPTFGAIAPHLALAAAPMVIGGVASLFNRKKKQQEQGQNMPQPQGATFNPHVAPGLGKLASVATVGHEAAQAPLGIVGAPQHVTTPAAITRPSARSMPKGEPMKSPKPTTAFKSATATLAKPDPGNTTRIVRDAAREATTKIIKRPTVEKKPFKGTVGTKFANLMPLKPKMGLRARLADFGGGVLDAANEQAGKLLAPESIDPVKTRPGLSHIV